MRFIGIVILISFWGCSPTKKTWMISVSQDFPDINIYDSFVGINHETLTVYFYKDQILRHIPYVYDSLDGTFRETRYFDVVYNKTDSFALLINDMNRLGDRFVNKDSILFYDFVHRLNLKSYFTESNTKLVSHKLWASDSIIITYEFFDPMSGIRRGNITYKYIKCSIRPPISLFPERDTIPGMLLSSVITHNFPRLLSDDKSLPDITLGYQLKILDGPFPEDVNQQLKLHKTLRP